MARTIRMILPLLAIVALVAACDDDDPAAPVDGPFTLTVQGNENYQGPHAGQTITVGLFTGNLTLVDVQEGTVSGTAVPSWSFVFSEALESGESYVVNYWIDSNFGEGAVGECDPPEVDHQWSVPFGPVQDDVTIQRVHDVSGLTPVCDTFE